MSQSEKKAQVLQLVPPHELVFKGETSCACEEGHSMSPRLCLVSWPPDI